MVKKEDVRSVATKKKIQSTFLQMMKEMPFQQINVKELTVRANINRGTFYTHYADITDLLMQMEEDMYEGFKETLKPMVLFAKQSDNSMVHLLIHIVDRIRENSDLCSVILGDSGDKAFLKRVLQLGEEAMLEGIKIKYPQISAVQMVYYYDFISAGFIAILERWLKEGMKIPASKIAGMMEKVMVEGIGFLETSYI